MAKSAKASSATTDKWYFEATDEELGTLTNLGDFEKLLLSKLVHTLRLGIHFYRRRHTDAEDVYIKSTTPSAKTCQKFVMAAVKNPLEGDKLFPLRLTAPSMYLITQLLPLDTPLPTSPMLVFKICVLRTFGVGCPDTINDLAKSLSTSEPDFKELDSVIQSAGKGKDKILRLVYGNLQVVRVSVPEMLEKFWAFAKEITNGGEESTLPTFESIQDILCNASIPTIKRNGLLAWLITSDLVEWNICQEPKIEDLDAHIMTKKAGPSGPTKALKRVEDGHKVLFGEEGGYVKPDPSEALVNVWRVLANTPAAAAWLQGLVEDCRKAQGRALSVVDLEHLLCKIDRYGGKA